MITSFMFLNESLASPVLIFPLGIRINYYFILQTRRVFEIFFHFRFYYINSGEKCVTVPRLCVREQQIKF